MNNYFNEISDIYKFFLINVQKSNLTANGRETNYGPPNSVVLSIIVHIIFIHYVLISQIIKHRQLFN